MKETIARYITEEIMEDPEYQLENDYKIIENSIIDSSEILKIILFIEETFAIEVDNDEIQLKYFNSVDDIYDFVIKKQSNN